MWAAIKGRKIKKNFATELGCYLYSNATLLVNVSIYNVHEVTSLFELDTMTKHVNSKENTKYKQ